MLYISRFLFLFIDTDQERLLRFFRVKDFRKGDHLQEVSLQQMVQTFSFTFSKLHEGLHITDIENFLFLILLIRFFILSIKYNLKTSFYITCIACFAGYLWYRHLIDLIYTYRIILSRIPLYRNLGLDIVQYRTLQRQILATEFKADENVHWYNFGQLFYSAVAKAVVKVDPATGEKYYIDPLSMIVANLSESKKNRILPLYYQLYQIFIPRIIWVCSNFWSQLSGIAAYVLVTRIGKKYCPYLIRWHWTLIVIIGIVEQLLIQFLYRVYYYEKFVLLPQLKPYYVWPESNAEALISILNAIVIILVFVHISFILFALFHAIWGQYFYIPFFVENTELHIGPRSPESVYSGGQTAWQDPLEKKKSLQSFFPKVWYGWFGRGTHSPLPIPKLFRFDRVFRKIKKLIKKCFNIH